MPRDDAPRRGELDCTIVMAARNREEQLPASLAALEEQSYPASRFELILVNDGSTDGTARVARGFRPAFPYRYFERTDVPSRACTRNQAIRAARGKVILFLDAECVAPPGIVAAHLRRHFRLGQRAVAGAFRLLAETVSPAVVRKDWALLYYVPQLGKACIPRAFGDLSPLLVTAHASCRREDVMSLGLFDEAFTGYGGEDLDLGYRLHWAGIRLASAPELTVFHQAHPPAPERDAQALANDRRVLRKNTRPWRVTHVLAPGADSSVAEQVAALIRSPELRQYRAEVVAHGAAAAALRRAGIPCLPPGSAQDEPEGRMIHLHITGGRVDAHPDLEGPAVVVTRYGADGPRILGCPDGLPTSPAVRSIPILTKLRYDSLLCGARYPLLTGWGQAGDLTGPPHTEEALPKGPRSGAGGRRVVGRPAPGRPVSHRPSVRAAPPDEPAPPRSALHAPHGPGRRGGTRGP